MSRSFESMNRRIFRSYLETWGFLGIFGPSSAFIPSEFPFAAVAGLVVVLHLFVIETTRSLLLSTAQPFYSG
jgi:hypothetical protein